MAWTSATCVQYVDGDPIGKLLAYASLLPFAYVLHAFVAFHARREVHGLLYLGGVLANEVITQLLKQLLREPRPLASCVQLGVCESHGMPSSHTSLAFFVMLSRLILLCRYPKQKSVPTLVVGALEVVALLLGAAVVAQSRVYLGYHTLGQVLAGAAVGCLNALLCFAVIYQTSPAFPLAASSRLGALLHLRDTWSVPDPVAADSIAYHNGKKRQ
ncbi:hypothetical protein QJQ45_002471 [Haematococcus lacustris]|nr:hypothetical protein QJQ45_002471 [Haematococcus lacustris]